MEYAEMLYLLAQYKYHLLFPLLMFQGPIVAVIAGFLASKGLFNTTALCVFVIVADLVTDTIIYCIGRWGRWGIVARWGKYIGLTSERTEKADAFMHKHGHWALAISKVAYSLSAPTMLLAGMARMKYWKFLAINFIVAVPKSILLVLLGYYVGSNIALAERYLNYVGIGILILLMVGGMIYWKRKKMKN